MLKFLEKNRTFVLISATLYSLIGCFPSIWSIFQESASNAYGITLQESAMMLPMCTAFFGIFYIVGGQRMNKMSARLVAIIGISSMALAVFGLSLYGQGTSVMMLYLCFSMPFGGGCGFCSAAFITWLYKWYADKNGFAAGVMAASSSIMLMGETYLAKYLLNSMGMRASVRLLGLVYLAIGIASAYLVVNPTDEYIMEKSALAMANRSGSDKAVKAVDFTAKEMLKTKQFYMLFFMAMCSLPAYQLMASSIVTMGVSRGLSEATAVSLVASSLGVSAVGKFIVPTLSDKVGRKKCIVVFEGLIFAASTILMFANGMTLFFAFNMLVLVHGSAATLILPFANDMFGLKYSSQNAGFINFNNTIGSFATPVMVSMLAPLAGANVNHIIAIAGSFTAFMLACLIDPNTAKLKK